MWCKQTFCLIDGTNTVVRDIVCDNYEVANQIARLDYGVGAIAIESTQYPITVGDTYVNGVFYRGEAVIVKNPTEAEVLGQTTADLGITKDRLDITSSTLDVILTDFIPTLMELVNV